MTSVFSPDDEILETRMLPQPPEVDQRTDGSYEEKPGVPEVHGTCVGGHDQGSSSLHPLRVLIICSLYSADSSPRWPKSGCSGSAR